MAKKNPFWGEGEIQNRWKSGKKNRSCSTTFKREGDGSWRAEAKYFTLPQKNPSNRAEQQRQRSVREIIGWQNFCSSILRYLLLIINPNIKT